MVLVVTKIMLLLMSLLAAENPFLQKISAKTTLEQVEILEKRIQIESKNPQHPVTSEIIVYYLEIHSERKQALDFLVNTLKKSSDRAQSSLLKAIIKSCTGPSCPDFSKIFKLITNEKSLHPLAKEVLPNIELEDFEFLLRDKGLLKRLVNISMNDPQASLDQKNSVVKLLIEFGLYKEAATIIDSWPKDSIQSVELSRCLVLYHLHGTSKSNDCFTSISGNVAKLVYYFTLLDSQDKVPPAELNNFLTDIASSKSQTLRTMASLLKMHIKSELNDMESKQIQAYLLQNTDYKQTFMFLALAKKIGIQVNTDLLNRYHELYPGTLLSQVLKGEASASSLKEAFGPRSLLYQSALL
jgi:hypothetical protein